MFYILWSDTHWFHTKLKRVSLLTMKLLEILCLSNHFVWLKLWTIDCFLLFVVYDWSSDKWWKLLSFLLFLTIGEWIWLGDLNEKSLPKLTLVFLLLPNFVSSSWITMNKLNSLEKWVNYLLLYPYWKIACLLYNSFLRINFINNR